MQKVLCPVLDIRAFSIFLTLTTECGCYICQGCGRYIQQLCGDYIRQECFFVFVFTTEEYLRDNFLPCFIHNF